MKIALIVERVNDANQIRKAFKGDDNIRIVVTEGMKVDNNLDVRMG